MPDDLERSKLELLAVDRIDAEVCIVAVRESVEPLASRRAVDDVDLDVTRGEKVAPTHQGKTDADQEEQIPELTLEVPIEPSLEHAGPLVLVSPRNLPLGPAIVRALPEIDVQAGLLGESGLAEGVRHLP